VRVAALALAAALLVTPGGGPGRAAAEPTRQEAREALGAPADVETRRRAAVWLGQKGLMDDAPALVQALRDRDPLVRASAEQSLWQVWSRSGDAEVDRLLALGIEQMGAREVDAAVETFSRVIARRPDFAEGWNKRATVHYLMGAYAKSLADCDEVLKRNPHHFGALSGYGMIYLRLDQPARALEYFERALAVNPNLSSVLETVEMLKRLLIQRRKDTI
jgi:tetratricopeptide (TPR) repeat protein